VRPVQVSHAFVVCCGGREELRIGKTPSLIGQVSRQKGSFVHRNGRYTEIRSEHSDGSSKPGSIAAEECPQVSLMQQ